MTGANSYAESTSALTAFLAEMVFTFIFVLVVLGVTDSDKGTPVMCGLAIGLTLVLVHIVCIPITGTSVNPARSVGPALFEGGRALSQLWLFIVAPSVGAALLAAGSSKLLYTTGKYCYLILICLSRRRFIPVARSISKRVLCLICRRNRRANGWRLSGGRRITGWKLN